MPGLEVEWLGGKSDKKHGVKARKQITGEVAALSKRVAEIEEPKVKDKVMGGALLPKGLLTSAAIEEMPDGVMLVGMDGKLAYMNRACEKLLGYGIDELIGKRATARKSRDFKESDRIRDELLAMGIVLKDTKDGTTWEVAR